MNTETDIFCPWNIQLNFKPMNRLSLISIVLIIFSLNSCRDDGLSEEITEEESITESAIYPDWSLETHSNLAEPDYDIVFNQDEVLRMDIEISSSNWAAMQDDLSSLYDSFSGHPVTESTTDTEDDPIWADCSLFFNDLEWYHVGIRYKGNSSLQSAYQSGIGKLSFKLDFDEFEDEYTGITNQRFYGFKQLNLKNNYSDKSLMREKVGSDLFMDFGLASPNTSFVAVYVDHGTGSQYFGLYTLVEEVDNTVIQTQFSSDSGNLYKPDGTAASFASGTFNTSEMELKTNLDIADYSDVRTLYSYINSSNRTSDTDLWKENLESIFDVDQFLRWLAANTAIQNWDTYGNMTHNYYLYNNPENNLLTWIPWDNNEAFQDTKLGALSLGLTEISSNWPLIRYIIDQEEYNQKYEEYLQEFVDGVFDPDKMSALYTEYYNLLKEYAYAEETGYTFIYYDSNFDNAVETLKSHASSRYDAVTSFLR